MIAPGFRLSAPLIEDFAYLAKRMRRDEIEQFLAYSGLTEYVPDIAARAFALTPGRSFVLVGPDDLPVLAGGFQPLTGGVYDGWMVGTDAGWEKHWRAITKTGRRLMDMMFADGAHRIQIASLASRTAAHAWYERSLHMTREGVLKRYCADGQDAVMFARTSP